MAPISAQEIASIARSNSILGSDEMRIAIVDDNAAYRRKIGTLLKSYLDRKHLEAQVEYFESGEALLSADTSKFDIIFLDVELGDLNGIQTARIIRQRQSDVFIIIVTSFVKYAVESHEVATFRYLVKNRMDDLFDYYMDGLIDQMHISKRMLTFDFVEGIFSFADNQLIYLESKGHRINFHLTLPVRKTFHLYSKLDKIEKELDPESFIRLHKSFIANMLHIEYIDSRTAHMSNNEDLPISKSRHRIVKERFSFYKGSL